MNSDERTAENKYAGCEIPTNLYRVLEKQLTMEIVSYLLRESRNAAWGLE